MLILETSKQKCLSSLKLTINSQFPKYLGPILMDVSMKN